MTSFTYCEMSDSRSFKMTYQGIDHKPLAPSHSLPENKQINLKRNILFQAKRITSEAIDKHTFLLLCRQITTINLGLNFLQFRVQSMHQLYLIFLSEFDLHHSLRFQYSTSETNHEHKEVQRRTRISGCSTT